MRGNNERRQPLTAEPLLTLARLRNDVDTVLGVEMSARNRPVESRRVNDVRVGWVDSMLASLTARSALVLYGRNVMTATAQIHDAPAAAVILDRTVYAERIVHVVVHVEELNQR